MSAPDQITEAPRRRRAVLPVVALVVATAALGLSVWNWIEARDTTPKYSDGERAQAEADACGAYRSVRTGVATNTNLKAPGGDGDVTGALATAANARVALIGGGQYLLTRVKPATPASLADPLTEFGRKLADFGIAATAGAQNSEAAQQSLLRDIESLESTLDGMCPQ